MSHVKWIKHPPVWTLFMSAAAFFLSCGGCEKNSVPEPDPTIDSLMCVEGGGQVVGPCGGTVTFSDSTYDVQGLEAEFQPGCTDHYLCFYPRIAQTPITDYYPSGFEEHVRWRCLELGDYYYEAYPQVINMRLSLPVEDISFEPDSSEVLVACYYDRTRDTWTMVMPKAAGDSTIIVESTFRQYWNWGVLNLEEADYEQTLKPLLEGIHGHDEWAAIEAEIQAMYEQIIDEDWDLSCATIIAIRDQFYSQAMDARTTLMGIQAEIDQDCGPCNVYSGQFIWDMVDYIGLYLQDYFWTQMALENGFNFVGVLSLIRLWMVWDDMARMCDYHCLMPLLRENYPDFWSIYFRYLFNALGYQLIECGLDSGYYDCG